MQKNLWLFPPLTPHFFSVRDREETGAERNKESKGRGEAGKSRKAGRNKERYNQIKSNHQRK